MSSSRHCTSTCIQTSSGIRSSSISWRKKSKSGWLADGNPTSISLKPMATSSVNMRILRVGSIGSINAWLPSRRSTEHHCGAAEITVFGQVRSSRTSGTKGAYLPNGIGAGVLGCGGIKVSIITLRIFRVWSVQIRPKKERTPGLAGGGGGERGDAAFALRKQQQASRRSSHLGSVYQIQLAPATRHPVGTGRDGTLRPT